MNSTTTLQKTFLTGCGTQSLRKRLIVDCRRRFLREFGGKHRTTLGPWQTVQKSAPWMDSILALVSGTSVMLMDSYNNSTELVHVYTEVHGQLYSLMPNTHHRRRRDSAQQMSRVGVGVGVRRCEQNSQLAHDDCRRIRSTVLETDQTDSIAVFLRELWSILITF